MACSWELRKQDCFVDIYESESRIGGHANSVTFKGNGASVDVDTGFVILDEATYRKYYLLVVTPSLWLTLLLILTIAQFSAFLGQLGVETIPADMSFGVSTADGVLDWSSHSVWSFVGPLSRLLRPCFWRLMFDVVRFSLFARDILDVEAEHSDKKTNAPDDHLETIYDCLRRKGYSEQFMTCFLMPMVAAPWCINPDDFAVNFPAKPLIYFMYVNAEGPLKLPSPKSLLNTWKGKNMVSSTPSPRGFSGARFVTAPSHTSMPSSAAFHHNSSSI